MLDTTADTWYTWLGLVAASLAIAGVAAGFPSAAPPSASQVAETVDDVATSEYEERETVGVEGSALRLGNRRVSIRSDGGTASASFARPVVPVFDGPLREVLHGGHPQDIFETVTAYERALQAARERPVRWRDAPSRLTVRRVTWGDVDATLVG